MTYVAKLKRLSEHCEFGGSLKEMLRDRFVCGLRDQRTTQRLLTEADLTFHKAVSISTTMEAASKDSRELCQAQGTASASVNKVSVQSRKAQHKPCYRCGGTTHIPADCWYKDKVCHVCKEVGHIRKKCTKGKGGNSTGNERETGTGKEG